MNRAKKILISLLLSFAVAPSVSSKNLNIEEISADFDSIQVGAFKERKNILYQNQLFSHYNTFIEYGDKFNRFYIVNIKKSDYLKVLEDVKKVNPSAFRANEKIKKILKKSSFLKNQPIAKRVQKATIKNPYHDSGFLNSDTILRTRKKFF